MAGNSNSGRKPNELVVRQNLLLILDEVDPTTDRKKMINILHQLVDAAQDGKMDAIKEVFDRVDGKAPQGVHGPGENGEHIIKAYGWLPPQE